MTTAKAEATGFVISRETTWGTIPTTGYMRLQPNPGGLQGFAPEFVDVNRDPLSKFATDEKGDHVGLNAKPVLVHDLNKDLCDIFAEGWTRSAAKVSGDEPTTAIYRPTAVVDGAGSNDSFTVAADGDLANGTLVYARGFVSPLNNGVFLLAGTPTTFAIKVATGTFAAETVSPTGSATVEVCGVQAIADDVAMNASGHLTSSTLDFTTLNLLEGHRVKIGDSVLLAASAFATTACNCWATVAAAPTANLLQLKWHTSTPSADAGAGKTIRIHFGRLYRNVAIDHADYLEPSWSGEKEDLGVGTANAAVYTYSPGMSINTVSIAMPVESKVVVTTNFEGKDITDPVLTAARSVGPSTAIVALATEPLDTATDLLSCKVLNAADGTTLIAEVNSCTLKIEHGVTPRKQLATFGSAGAIFGKIRPSATMEIYYERATVPTAIRNNTTCRFEAILRNGQCGIVFDMPCVTLRGGAMSYAANSPVMVNLELPAHRDPITNVVLAVNVLPYAPAV